MVAAQVRGARQRADKRSKVPRELPDLVLPPDGICTQRVISHDLSVPVHSWQVLLRTGRAGTATTLWRHPHCAITADCVHDVRNRRCACHLAGADRSRRRLRMIVPAFRAHL
jgi:hypothetical protein